MMRLDGFLRLINSPLIRRFVDRKREEVEAIDPKRIYVENIRAFFGCPHALARLLLEVAVREGAMERRIGVLCPYNMHIVESYSSEEAVPELVTCLVCEAHGREHPDHPRDELDRQTFYKLVSARNE